ncbi:hypothetical protein B0A78_11780 [Flavobacterium columnare NBRC 100251 = ATCC 23463]|uniref:Uncharacterized protein n=2 Tax=Flavobacterium columnare TaxID=996 RepID=G8XA43_FLACA|nr:hypothetical protein [Flavobacterium columnare]AEW85207.1 hypothetical protein FCOL_01790 [Flavobacterium columnare ATCC 49512]AMO19577.1 hypothetical protein UN65_03760 [Flavobacterium columnare]ANO49013.1 hypothetical protein Pf1_00765 [Flavobacterium columnare]APT22978.1 hypothetical protein BU993_10340 [Flavobacterium columnare]AUX17508.1 hypothetical protein AQ623_03865 [Flavobacterium columnare]
MKHINLNTDPKINSGYKVPDDYFLNFEDRIMSHINQEIDTPKIISFWKKKNIWIYGIAATIIISIFTWIYFNQTNTYSLTSTQEYLAYSDEITPEDLADYLTPEDLTNLEKELNSIDHQTAIYLNEYLN